MVTYARGREVVLGVGAGIAAYKSCDLLRRLKDYGFLVTVIPTPTSLHFVGKATWEALSGRKVSTDLWQDVSEVPHVNLGLRADLVVIAPATADLIARIAEGRADDLLSNTILTSVAPMLLVPSMHPQMWNNPATVANVALLRARGIEVIEPAVGRLTGNDSGVGRFPETSVIMERVQLIAGSRADLLSKNILISAGGTREAIDPVRFIGNRSTGKQGYALAFEAVRRGANVQLVSANVNLPDIEGVEILRVESAAEMESALRERFPSSDALIMCAAVADVRPKDFSSAKIKKDSLATIALEKNNDILASLTKTRRKEQVLLGFAAETSADLLLAGKTKLEAKGVDLLYLNNVADGRVFGEDETAGLLIHENGVTETIATLSKDTLATLLLDRIADRLSYPNV